MDRTVTCPSGLSGRVTHLSAGNAKFLGDARAMRSGRAAESILRACWVETTELGPYTFERDAVDWSQVLACDRVMALLMIRVATYGEREDLEVRCPMCTHKFIWDLPLLELPVRELPEESRQQIAAGNNRFEATVLDGKKVWFRLMTGRDQLKAIKLIQERNEDLVVAAIKSRVTSVEGVEGAKALEEFLSDLSMGEVQDLLDRMDEVDGGLETIFDLYCPSCQHEWELDLPLDLQRMFVPQRPQKRRRAGQALPRTGPIQ